LIYKGFYKLSNADGSFKIILYKFNLITVCVIRLRLRGAIRTTVARLVSFYGGEARFDNRGRSSYRSTVAMLVSFYGGDARFDNRHRGSFRSTVAMLVSFYGGEARLDHCFF
jgi:hypothetical protein